MTTPHTVAAANVELSLDTSRMDMEFRRAMASLGNTLATAGMTGGHAYGRALHGSILPHLRSIEGLIGTALGLEAFRRLSAEILRVGAMFDQLAVRMRYLTGTETVVKDIVEGAQKMGMSIESAAQAFSRIAVPAKELGLTRQEVITLHQALAALARIGGTTAGELRNALYQITQAMAAGRLGGDELRSMMENMALATQLLSRELGVGVGQLRILGEQGVITGDILAKAILGNAQQILDMFERMPPTLDMVHARLRNSIELLFNEIDKRWRLSQFYKDFVQGGLIKAIDALADAIRRGGIPTQRQEELAAIGITRDQARVARTDAERLLHYFATGQWIPLQEQKDIQERATQEFRENVKRLVDTISGWMRDAINEFQAYTSRIPKDILQRMPTDEDRAAALRLAGVAGARTFVGLEAIRKRLGELREYETLSPDELESLIATFAAYIKDLPDPTELEIGLSMVRRRLEKYGEVLRDFDRWVHQPIADVVQMVEQRMGLGAVLGSEQLAVLRERLNERLRRTGVRAQDTEFAEIASDILRELLVPYQEAIFRGLQGNELDKNKEWNAVLRTAGSMLRDLVLADLRRARQGIVESITLATSEALERYVRQQAERMADVGIAGFIAGEGTVREAVDLAREPRRHMAVLEAHRALAGDLNNIVNAVGVTLSAVEAAIQKIQERTRSAADRLKDTIKEIEQVELGRIEARRGQVRRFPMPEERRQEELARLNDMEIRLRRTVAQQLAAIDDEQMKNIRERIATIRESEEASIRRLLPAQAQIASIERDRERKLKEMSDELARGRKLYAEQADQAQRLAALEREIAEARAAVEEGSEIRIADVRADALRRALTLFEQQERAATDAARRWSDRQWQEELILRRRDENVAEMWAEFLRAAEVVRSEDYATLFERYARSIQAVIGGAEMQIEGLRSEEVEQVRRTLQDIRELGDSYEASAKRTLDLTGELARLDKVRADGMAKLAQLHKELEERLAGMTEEQRAQLPELKELATLLATVTTQIDKSTSALQRYEIDTALEKVYKELDKIERDAQQTINRLSPDAQKILAIDEERTTTVATLNELLQESIAIYNAKLEIAKKTNSLTEDERRQHELALQATQLRIAALQQMVDEAARIEQGAVRESVAQRAMQLFDAEYTAALRASRRFVPLQDEENILLTLRDQRILMMTRAFDELSSIFKGEELQPFFERFQRTVEVIIDGTERQIDFMRKDALDEIRRTLDQIRSIGESFEDSSLRALNVEKQLLEIDEDRLEAHRRLDELRKELVERIQSLPPNLRQEVLSIAEVNKLIADMRDKVDRATDAMKQYRIDAAREEVTRILSRMADFGNEIHNATRRTRSEVAELAELERIRARWMAEQAEYAKAFERSRSVATPEQREEFRARQAEIGEAIPRALATLTDFLTDSAARRVRQEILNTYIAIANAMEEQVPVALEIQNIELRTAALLDWIRRTRTELWNSEKESLRALIPLLDKLEVDLATAEESQVGRLYDRRKEALDELIERMEDLGDTALRAQGKMVDGEQKILNMFRAHQRELRELNKLYEMALKNANELSFLERARAIETRDETIEKLNKALVLGVENERARVERDIQEELDRVRNEVWSRQARHGAIPERKRAVDEAIQHRLNQLKELERQFGVFRPQSDVPGDVEKAEDLAARQRRAVEQLAELRRLVALSGELRKAEIDEAASERTQSRMRANIEVITDLERELNTVYDEREDFIGRWLDRLNEVATEAQRAFVREKAGLLFDREEEQRERQRIRDALRDLEESETQRVAIDARRQELALALETGRITREQHDLEVAINELRQRRIPLDAAEVQQYLQAVREASGRMEILEREQERLAFAREWTSTITEGLQNIATEAENAADAIRNMVRELAMLTIRYAFLDPSAKYLAGALSTGFASIGKMFGFASGGIMSSAGPVPIPAGRLARPMIGVFGEGAMAEAAVPLPDGRNIPVDLRVEGGFGGRVTNIAIDARASVDPAMVAANAHRAAAQLLAEMRRRGRMD